VVVARHELALDEARDAVRHRAAGDVGRSGKLPGRQPVRLARAPERRQHVELERSQPVRGKRGVTGRRVAARDPAHAAEDLHDIDLEVRPLPPPRSDDLVDLVASLGCLTHGRHIATPRRRGYTEPTADGCEHTEMGSPISWH